ncbi:hypothetical protein AB3S75_036389 [Citrus x aurantiifolia]
MEGGGGGGKVINNNINNGGEVRRIHIVYFLSRLGQVDHPHLIRVHHLSRNGVYLRDVKRWLAEVRGKDMPEAFSWSYKRRYKSGYVWQDLLNDDLITPISDNEYVLKGSESHYLPCCTTTFDTCNLYDDEKNKVGMLRNDEEAITAEQQKQPACSRTEVKEEEIQQLEDPKMETPRSQSHVQEQESSPVYAYAYGSACLERSTLTDDTMSMKHEREDTNYNINHINLNKLVPTSLTQKSKLLDYSYSYSYSSTSSSPSFYSGLLNKKKSKKTAENNNNYYYNNKDSIIQKKGTLPSSSSSSSSKSNKKLSSSSSSSSAQFAKSKSCSNGASNILRNLMKCGAVDTKNGVVVNVNRPPAVVESKPNTTRLSKSVNLPPAVLDTTGDNDGALNLICRGDQHQLGGSARFFVTTTSTWNNQHHPLYGARKSFDGTTSTTASNNKNKDGFAGPKPVSSAYHYNYKPVGGPTCSQCGKLFKPEKLQKHMKSCKGMKASSKSSSTAEPVSFEKTSSSSSGPPQSLRSTNLSPQPQSSGQEPSTSSSYLLTN